MRETTSSFSKSVLPELGMAAMNEATFETHLANSVAKLFPTIAATRIETQKSFTLKLGHRSVSMDGSAGVCKRSGENGATDFHSLHRTMIWSARFPLCKQWRHFAFVDSRAGGLDDRVHQERRQLLQRLPSRRRSRLHPLP
jgi:hypothetical protein